MPNRIREWRETRGLSLEDLADLVGLSPGYVSRIETENRNVTLKHIENFARALDVRGSDLVVDEHVATSGDGLTPAVFERLKSVSAQMAEAFASPKIAEEWRAILDEAFRTSETRRHHRDMEKTPPKAAATGGPVKRLSKKKTR